MKLFANKSPEDDWKLDRLVGTIEFKETSIDGSDANVNLNARRHWVFQRHRVIQKLFEIVIEPRQLFQSPVMSANDAAPGEAVSSGQLEFQPGDGVAQPVTLPTVSPAPSGSDIVDAQNNVVWVLTTDELTSESEGSNIYRHSQVWELYTPFSWSVI